MALPQLETSRLLTAREVAARLQVSVSWVLAHAEGRRRPQLPSVKMGKAVRFEEARLVEFIEQCRRAMAEGRAIR